VEEGVGCENAGRERRTAFLLLDANGTLSDRGELFDGVASDSEPT
jgi:hypothetical protein